MIRTLLLGSIIVTMALWLSACGFTPVYSQYDHRNNAPQTLSNIQIEIIPDQEGQFLRNLLIDRFYQDGYPVNPRYRLKVAPVQESIKDLDVTITSDTTRGQLTLKSNFTLVDTETDKAVIKRSLKAITSYNVLGSEFATRVTEKNARENALTDLARQIEQAIVLFTEEETPQ